MPRAVILARCQFSLNQPRESPWTARSGSVEKVGVEPDPKRVGPASWNLEYG